MRNLGRNRTMNPAVSVRWGIESADQGGDSPPPGDPIPGLSFIGGEMYLDGEPYTDYVWSDGTTVVYVGDEVLSFTFLDYMQITDPYEHDFVDGDTRTLRFAAKIPPPYSSDSRLFIRSIGTDASQFRFTIQPANLNPVELCYQDTYNSGDPMTSELGWHLVHLVQTFNAGIGYTTNKVYLDGVLFIETPWDSPEIPTGTFFVGLQGGLDDTPLEIQLTSQAAGLGFLTNTIPDPAADFAAWVFPT